MVLFHELEIYAKQNNVPIMLPEGIDYMTNYIKEHNIKNILEIGTAIGYSAIRMCMVNDEIKVTTIERNKDMYDIAIKNINKYNMNNRINVIFGDALEVDVDGSYDLIFIDAAKSQYIKFFNKYSPLLKDNGTIITDNLNFHGLRENIDSIESKNLRSMMRKLNDYIEFLENNNEYTTEFLNIGDGLGITKKTN
ncbi:MAG: O-methyltransferase [Bacilli bacterium]|nr:O-methyltransferase [Bacilli bacterium]